MDTKEISLGDIVSLSTHPYFEELTKTIISGDQLLLPPLMLITELVRDKEGTEVESTISYHFNCKCIWYSHKTYKFEHAWIMSTELKLIKKADLGLVERGLNRGDQVSLATLNIELAKKKSSMHYEDNSVSAGAGSTLINSLLSFLPPVMQVIATKPHESKAPLAYKKTGEIIRHVSALDVKCSWFNPSADRISDSVLPIEALQLLAAIDEKILLIIQNTIDKSKYLKIGTPSGDTLCKPRTLTYRSGYYLLRAYDYLANKIIEFNIDPGSTFDFVVTPYKNIAPKFDVEKRPEAVNARQMELELIKAIGEASTANAYIRIKYKNRNEQLSVRTLKNYRIAEGQEEGGKVTYLVGFCLLRREERTFKINRIQNYQELELGFK
jgi:hypothetical protein